MATGDPAFDRRFEIHGSAATVLAVLDVETRRLVARQDRLGGFDLQGRSAITRCAYKPTLLALEGIVRSALATAQRLNRTVDVPGALLDRATTDPELGVRAEALRALSRAFPDHRQTTEAARQATVHPDWALRILGGTILGVDGVAVLEAAIGEPGLRDATVATAVDGLGSRVTVPRTVEVLADARDRRRHATARACLLRLGRGPAEETVAPLVDVLKLDAELAGDAARALGTLGSSRAESALIAALGRDVPGLRLEAAHALARVGTVASVIRLKETAERADVDETFRTATRRAVASIQSRAAGADHGQLTLSDDQGGRLSLAAREAGQLSTPDGERGQLSVPEAEAGQLSHPPGPVRTG